MARETEDYSAVQGESLSSGSISFGRFEAESLSWERRSSFSHNRYLEEVEKYSTPGSVTQKKAYFEAHFKKKGRLPYASPEGQNAFAYQTTVDGIEDHMCYMEDYLDHGNGEQQQFAWYDEKKPTLAENKNDIQEVNGQQILFSWFDENPPSSYEHKHDIMENNGAQPQFDWYDETPGVSDEQEHDIIGNEQEEIISPEFRSEPAVSNEEVRDPSIKLTGINEQLHVRPASDTISSHEDEFHGVAGQETIKRVGCVDKLEKSKASESPILDIHSSSAQQKTVKVSPKVMASAEQKPAKSKLRTLIPAPQSPGRFLAGKNYASPDKGVTKTSNKGQRENTLRTKMDKGSPLRIPSPKSLKSADFNNFSAKIGQEKKSGESNQVLKKIVVIPKPVSGKCDADVRRSTNRLPSKPQISVGLTKPELKQSNVVFNFKSHERAEKRKEFYTKLEEKQHAKEVEMNEIQARTQEETEAQIKQLRRSLNFKATPMPAFYNESMPSKKTVVSQAKPTNLLNKSASPRSKSSLKVKSQLANQEVSQFRESTSSTQGGPRISEAEHGCLNPKGSPVKETTKKTERCKTPVHQQPVENKAKKGERVMKMKMMKGVISGSVAVHVAS
ncbi:hypothetical protein J5N97_019544 [Dioscorea zingiberensis]|uniref:TPX2 C-terminal domain-containing protein n=1 Tax=Dioscorea zingiberensis TaxID=325984 RepID=A0A9D5CEX1_9LILI|nr:hypothetical protein J5N97_019544 [Dioscorea zingiberensis]